MRRRYFWPLLLACSLALITLALAGEGQKADPTAPAEAAPGPFVYVLETDGQLIGEFTSCVGLGSSNEIEEQTAITTNGQIVTKAGFGALQWPPIRLRREGPGDVAVWQWRKMVESMGLNAPPRTGHISMYTAGSTQSLAVWSFQKAWPVRLVCDEGRLELVIIHDGLSLAGTEPATRTAGRTR